MTLVEFTHQTRKGVLQFVINRPILEGQAHTKRRQGSTSVNCSSYPEAPPLLIPTVASGQSLHPVQDCNGAVGGWGGGQESLRVMQPQKGASKIQSDPPPSTCWLQLPANWLYLLSLLSHTAPTAFPDSCHLDRKRPQTPGGVDRGLRSATSV